MIAEAGENKAKKVEAEYDFEANKNGGEWVPYLTQFGGSISQRPLNVETKRTEGEKIEIDFASYVMNNDGYKVTWNKVSGKGTLGADGKYTLDALTAEGDVIEIEVYSAFDKLSFKLTLTATSEGDDNPDPTPDDGDENGDKDKGGLSAGAIAGICVGGAVVLGGIGAGAYFLVKKRKK